MRKLADVERDRAQHGEGDDEEGGGLPPLPAGAKNYITPAGHARIHAELQQLLDVERPALVKTVAWAASNGDRSENADYQYGKRRLRQIDSRIRFLARRMEAAEVVDPARQENTEQVFFGATVTYATSGGDESTIQIVGVDEAVPSAGRISWVSPVARALLKARAGDLVNLMTPAGREELEVLEIRYQ